VDCAWAQLSPLWPALERKDVAGLALIAPIVNAKAYLRELRALQLMMGEGTASDTGSLQSAGFVMTADTQATLKASIWLASASPAARFCC